MTCIVGMVEDDKVWMGGDSACSYGHTEYLMANHKVFENRNVLMGISGSARVGNLLEEALQVPDHPSRLSDESYVCTKLVDAIRQCLSGAGAASKYHGKESYAGEILLGYNGALYSVAGVYDAIRPAKPYFAHGCGWEVALGALHILEGQKLKPETKVERALEAAETYSRGVRAPFHIISGAGVRNG